MKMDAYLRTLERGLKHYPSDFVAETMEVYTDMIMSRMKRGMRDQEIIEELGTPDEVLDHIRQTYGDQAVSSYTNADRLDDGIAEISSRVSDVFSFFSDVADAANKGMQNAGSDFSSYMERRDRSFKTLFADGQFAKLTVILGSDTELLIEHGENCAYYFKGESRYDDILVADANGEMRIRAEREGHLILRVPHGMEMIAIRGGREEIVIRGLRVSKLAVSSSREKVCLSQMKVKACLLQLDGCDVHMSDFSAESLSVEDTDGEINLNGVRAFKMKITSGNGDIKGRIITENAEVRSEKGDADIRMLDAFSNILIRTISGDILFTSAYRNIAACCSTEGEIVNNTSLEAVNTGTAEICIGDGEYKADLKSEKGDITVSFI